MNKYAGYDEKLTEAINASSILTVEHADTNLVKWVTIRRYDGRTAAGYGVTFDEAAADAFFLYRDTVKGF